MQTFIVGAWKPAGPGATPQSIGASIGLQSAPAATQTPTRLSLAPSVSESRKLTH